MARVHTISPQGTIDNALTVRLGAGTGSANNLSDLDVGKIVTLVGESRYDLAAAGAEIEALITSVESATQGGYSIGGIVSPDGIETPVWATADGSEAAGTGALTVGQYVVAGAITAKGTALAAYPKVRSATSQGTQKHLWRVVSLGPVGTGAVGTQICIARV